MNETTMTRNELTATRETLMDTISEASELCLLVLETYKDSVTTAHEAAWAFLIERGEGADVIRAGHKIALKMFSRTAGFALDKRDVETRDEGETFVCTKQIDGIRGELTRRPLDMTAKGWPEYVVEVESDADDASERYEDDRINTSRL